MKRKRVERPTPQRAGWPWAAPGTVVVTVVAIGMLGLRPGASGGTPRLVLTRGVVDLGDLPFEAPAQVLFTLLSMAFTMHAGMGGPHELGVPLRTNNPEARDRSLIVRSFWGPR